MGGKSNNQNSSSNSSSSTEFSLVTITAVVHHYNADTQKWIVVGPARVGIYHDTEANSFRIVARRIGEESHEVVANCPVGETFSYNESTPSFHQWRDQVGPTSASGPGPSRVLGVKFGSTEEGALFADTIRRILATFESVHRMMLESGAAVEDGGHHPHLYHPQNYHHNHQYSHQHQHQQQQQLPPQNPPPPVPGSSSSGGSQSSSSSLYGGSGDQPPHFAAAAVLQRGKPVPPPPPPPSLNGGSLKNGGGAPVNGSGSSSSKPAIQPKPGFLSEMEITLARRRAKIEAADGGGGVGGSEVEISLNGRDHHQPVLPILSRKNSTSEQLSTFAPLNKTVNGLHPSNSFSNPSSPSIEQQQQPIGVNGSPQMMSPLAIEKLKQEILGEIRQEFAAFKVELLQVIKEQMSSH